MKEEIPATKPFKMGTVSDDDGNSIQSSSEDDQECKNWLRSGVGIGGEACFFLKEASHSPMSGEASPGQRSCWVAQAPLGVRQDIDFHFRVDRRNKGDYHLRKEAGE